MKIVNNSSEFKLTYDNVEYTIPEGFMEITNDPLGIFILSKAKQWGKKVIKTEDSKKAFIKPIVKEAIKKEEPKVEIKKKEIKEETKKEEIKTKTKTKK